VLHYLGRYTHRVAISNHRLVSFNHGQVTFRWRDSAHHNEQKLMRSRRNIVSEHPAAVGVVERVKLRFKELWKNRSLVFPQLRHFPQRFSLAAFALRC
jgi:hypothetical protein